MNSGTVAWARTVGKLILDDAGQVTLPPQEGARAHGERVIARSFTARTRGYIEQVVEQINETYENACYDACSVMIRRLAETLIIECFEAKGIETKVKDSSGHFKMLSDLVDAAVAESDVFGGAWNLSRNCKASLGKLKAKGDLSAHNRRYLAHRSDIDGLADHLRIVTQELVSIAGIQSPRRTTP